MSQEESKAPDFVTELNQGYMFYSHDLQLIYRRRAGKNQIADGAEYAKSIGDGIYGSKDEVERIKRDLAPCKWTDLDDDYFNSVDIGKLRYANLADMQK